MKTTQLCILTGASRGLGAALAEQSLRPGARLLCLSRREHPTLAALAAAAGAQAEQWAVDLAEPAPVAARLEAWLAGLDDSAFASATLINNAATLPRVGPLEDSEAGELARTLRVGLEAPLLLSAAFLRATRAWSADRRILNISSGLGRRAMAGSTAYCAIKAGLDHASRAMALDGARVVSLAPGVIDTDMQVHLRDSDPRGFPDHARFVALKADGQLDTPAQAAARVLAFLARPDFGREPVADVRT
ncbi:SDR family NAD(P)-dependent oxidoreductase [uncultured Methylibium sp.]|uniref:SDR family NAD(P)-dependent oxidoreductase n=1 Tax=uncultured Methylibium sp. TaxID=381093 RepID=UPI0025F1FCA2|nr:SDR family NAD(P)-dependent oxidoreductase [uncultured Methylibium sp.]